MLQWFTAVNGHSTTLKMMWKKGSKMSRPDILLSLYYALIYPFLTYGIILWGNTYKTTHQPIFILQKRAMRLITFFRFDEHSSPLFKSLEIIKFKDLL